MKRKMLIGVLVVLGLLLAALTAGLSLAQGGVPSASSDPASAVQPAASEGERELGPELAPDASGASSGSSDPLAPGESLPAQPGAVEPEADPELGPATTSGGQSSDPLPSSR